jgi:hypothetical protein
MKKSEMELNIATNIVITKPYIDFKEAQALAEIALISVLENGMLPPFSPPEKLSVMQDERKYTLYYKWELEND